MGGVVVAMGCVVVAICRRRERMFKFDPRCRGGLLTHLINERLV